MPGWSIHLEVGERVAKKLKLSEKKRKEFLLGCILPDINNGYLNKVKVEKAHSETHYAFDQKSSLNFYAENRKQIDAKEPIFLGCLLHLYTDGYFNYDFYRTIKRSPLGEGLSRDQKSEIKHHDFWIYDACFSHQLNITKSDSKGLAELANKISVIDLTPDDIMDVMRILSDQKFHFAMKNKKYIFYTKNRLDQLLENMIDSFSKKYLGEEDA